MRSHVARMRPRLRLLALGFFLATVAPTLGASAELGYWPSTTGAKGISTIRVTRNIQGAPNKILPGLPPQQYVSQTTGFTSSMARRTMLPGARTRIGPFNLQTTVNWPTSGINRVISHTVTTKVTLRVLGRSPAVLGTRPNFAVLGTLTRSFTNTFMKGAPTTYQKLETIGSIDVTLPGALDAVKLEWVVDNSAIPFGDTTKHYEGTWPSTNCTDIGSAPVAATDEACLQANVMPTGWIVPSVVPLSIVYEPPGNCSWARTEATATTGTEAYVEESTGSVGGTLEDIGLPGDARTDVTQRVRTEESKVSSKSRKSNLWFTQGEVTATQFGYTSGRAGCNSTEPVSDISATNGPGRGDILVLGVNYPMAYWDTENLRNFRISPTLIAGQPDPQIVKVPARDFHAGNFNNLPSVLRDALTRTAGNMSVDRQIKSIASIDPFIAPAAPPDCSIAGLLQGGCDWFGPGQPVIDPNRFVSLRRKCDGQPLQQIFGSGTGIADGEDLSSYYQQASDTQTTRYGEAKIDRQVGLGAIKLFPKLITMFVSAAGGGAAGGVIGQVLDQVYPLITADVIADINRRTVTTTIANVSRGNNSKIGHERSNSFTESFFIHEKDAPELNVEVLYDLDYGTFAFRKLATCAGTGGTADLPEYVWPIRNAILQFLLELPFDLFLNLASQGVVALEAAPAMEYQAAIGAQQGLAPGRTFDANTRQLRGLPTTQSGTYNALYYGKNLFGKRVARVWLTERF